MSKNTTDLRDEVAMWVETAVHKFHASDGVVIMNDVVEESVAEIVTLISNREKLARIEEIERIPYWGTPYSTEVYGYEKLFKDARLATLRKELDGGSDE
jgi:formyltetrahydrofolate hydrolase